MKKRKKNIKKATAKDAGFVFGGEKIIKSFEELKFIIPDKLWSK